jgi:hypothetical protein
MPQASKPTLTVLFTRLRLNFFLYLKWHTWRGKDKKNHTTHMCVENCKHYQEVTVFGGVTICFGGEQEPVGKKKKALFEISGDFSPS